MKATNLEHILSWNAKLVRKPTILRFMLLLRFRQSALSLMRSQYIVKRYSQSNIEVRIISICLCFIVIIYVIPFQIQFECTSTYIKCAYTRYEWKCIEIFEAISFFLSIDNLWPFLLPQAFFEIFMISV